MEYIPSTILGTTDTNRSIIGTCEFESVRFLADFLADTAHEAFQSLVSGGLGGLAAGARVLAYHQHPAVARQLADGGVKEIVNRFQIGGVFHTRGIKHQGGEFAINVRVQGQRFGLVAAFGRIVQSIHCLLYTSDAADE